MQFNAGFKGTLDDAKAEAKATIDKKAGEVRQRYITSIPAQDAIYQFKSEEVDRWQNVPGSEHTEANFPFVHASQRANGLATAQEARDRIAARRAFWVERGALSEEIREGGKRAVDNAATVRDAFEARDVAVEDLDLV